MRNARGGVVRVQTRVMPAPMNAFSSRYYLDLGAAFVRGRLGATDELSPEQLFQLGLEQGLRLHKFKRSELPRVRRVLGILRGVAPGSVLDVGSGRGAFLWPMLDAFPATAVIAADTSERRMADILAVRRGGIRRLMAVRMDAARLALADDSVDVVTILEVLEHLSDPAQAASEAVRIARQFVIASVPLHEDCNPEHLHLFSRGALERLLLTGGARRVNFEYVLNHTIVVATL
jgi:SAM-dependent methyltransferase